VRRGRGREEGKFGIEMERRGLFGGKF